MKNNMVVGRTSKAIKGTMTSFLQYGLQIVLQAILMPLILHMAGSETIGAYAILMQVMGYGILLDLGFGTALSRYLAQTFGFSDGGKKFVDVFNGGRIFYLVSNIIFGLLVIIFSFWVNSFLQVDETILNQARLSLYLYGLWIILRTPIAIYNHALNASQNMAIANFIAIVGNAVRLIGSLVLILLKAGLVGLILANIIAEALTYYLQYRYFNRLFPHYKFGWKITDWPLFKEVYNFGLKYYGVNIANVFFYGIDSLIVGYLYGAAAASIYYLTKMPTYLVFQLIFRISDNAAPAANELFAKGDFTALRKAYFRILRYSVILIIPFAILMTGLNRILIFVWANPSQYAGDVMTIFIAVFAIVQVISHVDATVVVVFGKIKGWSTLAIVTGILQLPLALLLGKTMGLQGIALAGTVMCLPGLLFLLYRSITVLEIKIIQLWHNVYKQCIWVCIPMALLTVIIKIVNPLVGWSQLIMLSLVYVMIWALGVYKMFIQAEEKDLVRSVIRSYFHGKGVNNS